MTTYTVPTSITNPTSGDTVYLPGHASYVATTDVSDALLYWLTTNNGGIGSDGFCGMSGHTIQFRAEEYPLEYGTVWGLAQNQASYTDRSGNVWPQVKQHAWRNLTIDLNGAEWVQADNTTYDDGLVDGTGDTVAGDGTTITLTTPLTDSQITRLRAATGSVPAISGFRSNGTGTLFTRKSGTGGVSSRAQIASCANDGTTVTLAAGNTCNETLTDATITIYLGAREGRRNDKLWMFAVACPGAKNAVERSWMNSNITIGGGTIRMGNTAGATSVFTAREQWHCYRIRAVDGLTIDSTMRGEFIWGDVLNTGQVAQSGVSKAGLHAENVTMGGIYDTCGRHAITGQGHIGLTVSGCTFRDIGRLGWDAETTSATARVFDTLITDSVFDPGTVFWHQSPAVYSGEPHWTLSVTTVNGSDRITVPYDLVNSDDLGSGITGTGIPAGTYVRRRMGPTELELSAACTASGTITATLSPAVPFRDFTCRYVDNSSGTWNFAGNTACTGSRAYFTGTTVEGSPTIADVQWEDRLDALEFTTADIDTKVYSVGGGTIATGVPASATSTTVTMPTNALVTVDGIDRTVSGSVLLNRRSLTTATNTFTSADKGRIVTGTGIRPGTVIESFNGARSVDLSLPTTTSGTTSVTISGRARFYATIGPAKWDGYTIENCRNIGNGKWGGSSVVWQATHQPLILMPARCDNVTVRRNFMTGARNNSNAVVEYGFGYFDPPANTEYGADPAATTTFANNRFVDMVDDQAATPTVTSSVSLSGTNLTTARPTLTAVVSFSDARQERGGIVFYRNGTVNAGAAPIVSGTNTATFTPFTDSPTGIHLWTAKWVGSWDTLTSTSSSVTQNVGGVSPTTTTTTLTASPTSPRDEGTSITLSATVSPDPGNGSSVAFYDETTLLGTGTTTSGVATLSTTFVAGSHALVAQYAGSATYQASSGTLTFVSNAVDVDTTPPTLDTESPAANATGVDVGSAVTMTFSESVSGLTFVLRLDGASVSGDLTGSGTSWTFTPTDDLVAGRTYTAILDDCVDGVGNHLAGRVSWTFTTEDSGEYIPDGLLVARPS